MKKHAMTVRCEIAVKRAKSLLDKALRIEAEARESVNRAKNDLARAEYELSLNLILDAR